MFTLSTAHGACPYDGFWIHSDQLPKASFLARLKPQRQRFSPRSPWRNFRSFPLRGEVGALKVMWDLRNPYSGAPTCRIYINPSVAGLSAQETLRIIASIIDAPLEAKVVQLDTKVDVEGTAWRVAGHVYMPYVRFKDNWDFPGTVYEGKGTRLTIYQKAGWHGEFPYPFDDDDAKDEVAIARVEIRQRLKTNRPTLLEFLRGDRVATNIMRRLRVVADLDLLQDRVLAEEALKRGLTRAVREYPTFCRVSIAEIKRTKRLINDNGFMDFYDLYLEQAAPWHAAFLPPQ